MDMSPQTPPNNTIRIWAGVLTGVIAGTVMLIPLMLFNMWAPGHDIFYGINIIATWAGWAPKLSGMGAETLVGLAIHLAFSAVLGVVWGLAIRRRFDQSTLLFAGMIYGILVYWAVEYLASPILNPVFTQTIGLFTLIAYLVFGACFVFYPFFEGKIARRLNKDGPSGDK